MTYLLSIDPGGNTGIALGFYDATTPYRLVERWQVHGGLEGFKHWWLHSRPHFDEIIVEKFILSADNEFDADLTPVYIEGALSVLLDMAGKAAAWQPRTEKSLLTGYPKGAQTKAQKQRVRFDFLERFGLFKAGTENDDSNDAITHALVYLKKRMHEPTRSVFWPAGRSLHLIQSMSGAAA